MFIMIIYVDNVMEFTTKLIETMSLPRLWDIKSTYKNRFRFYMLAMYNHKLKEKLSKRPSRI